MKIKQTLKRNMTLTAVALGMVLLATPLTVSAVSTCAGVDTSIISCTQTGNLTCKDGTVVKNGQACADKSKPVATLENTGVWGLLLMVINIMTAGIGVLAVAGIVYGSILYTSAGDSSEKVSKAREVIRNVVIGILAYALMYAVLNFIIPGGLFTS